MITKPKKKLRGLACCSPEERSRIARLGGKALLKKRGHLSKIGTKGGKATARHWKKLLTA
jgi:hypothetical protein